MATLDSRVKALEAHAPSGVPSIPYVLVQPGETEEEAFRKAGIVRGEARVTVVRFVRPADRENDDAR